MILFFNQDLLGNPLALIAYLSAFLVALVLGIAFHEFCHAWSANELGDNTAARQGRLTLNPVVHIDPLGMLMIFLVGFGWGRPTPVNPYNLRVGPQRGNALVALAGPASNFFFAALAAIPLRMGWVGFPRDIYRMGDASGGEIIGYFLFFIVLLNVLLGLFNLIPIHPLDGFKVVVGAVPREIGLRLERLAPYGPGLLLALVAIGIIAPQYSPIRWFVGGLQNRVIDLLI